MMDCSSSDDFFPNEVEQERIFNLLTSTPTDIDDADHCVFSKKKMTETAKKRAQLFQLLPYRQLKFHPKYLLYRWYFGEDRKSISRVSCFYSEWCVNPFHLKKQNENVLIDSSVVVAAVVEKKMEQTKCIANNSLMSNERKRKHLQFELENDAWVLDVEQQMFSPKMMVSPDDERHRKKIAKFQKIFDTEH